MKIAVPTRDGRVDDHFGHCAYYTIFDIIDGKVAGVSKMASPEGCGCKSGIAPVLRQHLGYGLPEEDVEWFYNEVVVPEEGDIPSSYYMACGFGQGYFARTMK